MAFFSFIEILNSRNKEIASSIIYMSEHIQITQRQQQMPAVTVWAAAQNPEAPSSREHCESCERQESDVKKVPGRGQCMSECEPSPDKGEGCLPVVKGGLSDREAGIGCRIYRWMDHIHRYCPPHTTYGLWVWPPKMGYTALLATWMGKCCWVSSGAKEGFAWLSL